MVHQRWRPMPLRSYSAFGSRKRISRENMVFQITDGLFQSGTQLLEPRDCREFDFTVNLAHEDGPCKADIHWGIDDGPLPNTNHLNELAKIVAKRVHRGDAVLVFCSAGINRSSLVSALALVYIKGISGQQAIEEVRRGRPGALNNPNFVDYLSKFSAPKAIGGGEE